MSCIMDLYHMKGFVFRGNTNNVSWLCSQTPKVSLILQYSMCSRQVALSPAGVQKPQLCLKHESFRYLHGTLKKVNLGNAFTSP